MTVSQLIAVPLLAGLSLAVSLVLLPIQGEAPHSGAIALQSTANPA